MQRHHYLFPIRQGTRNGTGQSVDSPRKTLRWQEKTETVGREWIRMNNSGLVKNNQQSYYHLNFYERAAG